MRREIDGIEAKSKSATRSRASVQGRGIATEAARACMNYAFIELGEDRVISLIRPENLPSRRVAERNGMAVEKETDFLGLPHLVYVAPSRSQKVQPQIREPLHRQKPSRSRLAQILMLQHPGVRDAAPAPRSAPLRAPD